jgi:hypothetical protein
MEVLNKGLDHWQDRDYSAPEDGGGNQSIRDQSELGLI